jgi:hypothetical protein
MRTEKLQYELFACAIDRSFSKKISAYQEELYAVGSLKPCK